MKKIFKYSLAIASATLLFSACTDFLKEKPTDLFGEEDAYKNPSLIYSNTVANIYAQFGGEGSGASLVGVDRGIYDLNTFTSDEAFLPTRGGDWEDGGTWQRLYLHRWSTRDDLFTNSWNYLYKVIGLCNNAIDVLDYYSKEVPGWAAELQTYKQEVRAIRAYYYYYLLDMFARVPLVTSSSMEMKDVEQSSRSKVFEFVVDELHTVLPDLIEFRSNQEGEYYGRMTKPVVWMLLAKLALNAEVYTDDDWTDGVRPDGNNIRIPVDGTTMNAWEATIAYVDKLTEFGYVLEPDFRKNFTVKNDVSSENILTLPMDPSLYKFKTYNVIRSLHYAHSEVFGYSGWNGACATLTAVSKFGYSDMQGNLLSGAVDPRMEMTYFVKDNVVGPDGKPFEVEVGGVSFPMQYLPHRVRLLFDNSYSGTTQTIPGFSDTYGSVPGTVDEKISGGRMAKYELDPAAQNGGEKPANDIVLFRYADALLMKAEAKIRLYGAGSGDSEINQVRNRVDASPLTGATLEDIADERLRELAWEGVRRQDQIRFGTFTARREDRNENTAHSLGTGQEFRLDTKGYTTVFPIDVNIMALNPKLNQNPGY